MPGFEFNKIVVAESLPDGEFKSGTELARYLGARVDDAGEGPGVEIAHLESAEHFRGLIDLLSYEARHGERPLLHVETHGWANASGLVFADDSDLTWDDLRVTLATLNVAANFNLVVSMAACFGGHFVQELRPGQIAPCLMVVGPTNTTDRGQEVDTQRNGNRRSGPHRCCPWTQPDRGLRWAVLANGVYTSCEFIQGVGMFDLSLSSLLEEAFRAADDVADRHGSGFGLVQLVDVIKLAANLKAVSAEEYAESEARINAKILEVRKKMPGDVTASSCVDSLVNLKRVLKQLATGQAIPRDLE